MNFLRIVKNHLFQISTTNMKYRELKDQLEKYNDEQLDKDVIVWNTNDQEFYDAEFQEIMKASDELNDPDASYFVI